MEHVPRESPETSREKLLARLWDKAYFMPWTRKRTFSKQFTTDATCVFEIPRGLFPLEFATFHCPKDQEGACRIASLLLLNVSICRKAGAEMVIEELVDDVEYEAAVSGVMSDDERVVARRLCVRALRFWFMYRSDEAAAALEVLAQKLAPDSPGHDPEPEHQLPQAEAHRVQRTDHCGGGGLRVPPAGYLRGGRRFLVHRAGSAHRHCSLQHGVQRAIHQV